MPSRKYKRYPAEFKESSAKLALESAQPMSQTARELGVDSKSLYNWVKIYSDTNEDSHLTKEPASEEIKRLKKELSQVKLERDILKKAAAYLCRLGTLQRKLYKVRLDCRASPSFPYYRHVLFSARIPQLILSMAQPFKN